MAWIHTPDQYVATRTFSLCSHEPQRDVFGVGGRHEPECAAFVIYGFCFLDFAGFGVEPLGLVCANGDCQQRGVA